MKRLAKRFYGVTLYLVISAIAAFQVVPAEAQGTPNFVAKFNASGNSAANSNRIFLLVPLNGPRRLG
jgi:hypothetical protein